MLTIRNRDDNFSMNRVLEVVYNLSNQNVGCKDLSEFRNKLYDKIEAVFGEYPIKISHVEIFINFVNSKFKSYKDSDNNIYLYTTSDTSTSISYSINSDGYEEITDGNMHVNNQSSTSAPIDPLPTPDLFEFISNHDETKSNILRINISKWVKEYHYNEENTNEKYNLEVFDYLNETDIEIWNMLYTKRHIAFSKLQMISMSLAMVINYILSYYGINTVNYFNIMDIICCCLRLTKRALSDNSNSDISYTIYDHIDLIIFDWVIDDDRSIYFKLQNMSKLNGKYKYDITRKWKNDVYKRCLFINIYPLLRDYILLNDPYDIFNKESIKAYEDFSYREIQLKYNKQEVELALDTWYSKLVSRVEFPVDI